MGSKGGGKGGGRRKRGKGAGNRSTPKRSPQGNDAGADTSPGSTASPSGKSPATNRRKVDNADPSTMEVEALDDGTEAAAAKAAEEAAQRLEAEAESQNVTPDETEKIAKAKEPTPPTDQEEQDGQDRADGDEESPRSPPQRQKAYAKVAAFSDSDSDDDEVLDLTDILKPSERQEQANHMLAPSSYEKVARIWAQTALAEYRRDVMQAIETDGRNRFHLKNFQRICKAFTVQGVEDAQDAIYDVELNRMVLPLEEDFAEEQQYDYLRPTQIANMKELRPKPLSAAEFDQNDGGLSVGTIGTVEKPEEVMEVDNEGDDTTEMATETTTGAGLAKQASAGALG